MGIPIILGLLLIGVDGFKNPAEAGAAEKYNVAIIGAGVGGSASAWFLREQLGPRVQLDM